MTMRSLLMAWWLLMTTFGVLAMAGCQASAPSSTPTVSPEATNPVSQELPVAEPTATTIQADTAGQPAVESDATDSVTQETPSAGPAAVAGQDAGADQADEAAEVVNTVEPATDSSAANADVEFVRASQSAGGSWRFDVTVRHPDSGWEDYADGWDVVTLDGQVLKANESDPFTRLLLHPHENEQPFTRSQSGIVVPSGVTVVIVRAHDLVDGFGGREVRVDLTSDGGAGYEVTKE